ncbi:UNVERIFIED_CONTAM: hypothetical protein HDU68_011540 [Siphonaria sp. JEL0065]|nr:hypothetical protein HDU68_011540 [Siphonaria sp. JEL0065]
MQRRFGPAYANIPVPSDMQELLHERPISVPGLPNFVPFDQCDYVSSFVGDTLQVIVKIANIHLIPEKPSYAGGGWHLDGMENEAIVATGILYYDMESISPSRLSFREIHKGTSLFSEQDNYWGLEKVFGFHNQVSNNTQRT